MFDELQRLKGTRGAFANGAALERALKCDAQLRSLVERLARHYLQRRVTGCLNCYTDAYFELLNYKIDMAEQRERCLFRLRNGALLKDVHGDPEKMATNYNLTNELAVYHLTTNPLCRRFFDAPDDIDAALAQLTSKADSELAPDSAPRKNRKKN